MSQGLLLDALSLTVAATDTSGDCNELAEEIKHHFLKKVAETEIQDRDNVARSPDMA